MLLIPGRPWSLLDGGMEDEVVKEVGVEEEEKEEEEGGLWSAEIWVPCSRPSSCVDGIYVVSKAASARASNTKLDAAGDIYIRHAFQNKTPRSFSKRNTNLRTSTMFLNLKKTAVQSACFALFVVLCCCMECQQFQSL